MAFNVSGLGNLRLAASAGTRSVVATIAVGAMLAACNAVAPATQRPAMQVPVATSPSPTAAPAATGSAVQSPIALEPGEVALDPGATYSAEFQGYRYTFTVFGPGWTGVHRPSEVLGATKDDSESALAGLLVYGQFRELYPEPCQFEREEPGTRAEEFATALANLDGFQTSKPTDVTVSGYHGRRLQLTVPLDADFADCLSGKYQSFEGRYYQGPGQTDDIRLLNLDGSGLLYFTTFQPETRAQTRTELEQMADSFEIDPAAVSSTGSVP